MKKAGKPAIVKGQNFDRKYLNFITINGKYNPIKQIISNTFNIRLYLF